MAQIINDPGRSGYFAQGVSGGLNNLLSGIAQQRMQNMERQQSAQALEGLGFSPIQAYQSSFLDPSILREIVKSKVQEPSNQAYAESLSQLLGGGTSQPSLADILGSQAPQEYPLSNAQELGVEQALENKPRVQQQLKLPAGLKPQQAEKLAELSLKQRRNELEERKFSASEQKEVNKETKAFVDKIYKEAESAQKNNMRLGRMEELIDSGKLSNPIFSSLLDTASKGILGFGLDLTALQSPESQEFKKLSTDFLKEAKDVFGARLTDADIRYFLQTVPTLSQSDAGKRRVIANLRAFNEAARLRKEIAQRVIKENRGKRPADLQEQVEEIAAPLLDNLSQKFKSGYEGNATERNLARDIGDKGLIGGLASGIPQLLGKAIGL